MSEPGSSAAVDPVTVEVVRQIDAHAAQRETTEKN